MSNYSKAARGLFVLPRLIGIFTDNAISSSLSLRQCSHHYPIRAGQNLPDKEFRSYGIHMSPYGTDYIFIHLILVQSFQLLAFCQYSFALQSE